MGASVGADASASVGARRGHKEWGMTKRVITRGSKALSKKLGRLSALMAALLVLGGALGAQAAPTPSPQAAPNAINMSIGGEQDARVSRILPDYNLNYNRPSRSVSLVRKDGKAKAFLQILAPAAHLSTTKAYAQSVMDSYSGWGLTAQIARRGFSFQYVDNAPCAGLVTYFDGSSYLLYGACGFISQDELTKAFSIAKMQLDIDDLLGRSAAPSLYY